MGSVQTKLVQKIQISVCHKLVDQEFMSFFFIRSFTVVCTNLGSIALAAVWVTFDFQLVLSNYDVIKLIKS